MSDTVFCRKFKEELPKMIRPPYPGPKGEELFNSVSKKAWDEWTALQTTLINEKQLDLSKKDDRNYLNTQLELFLNNDNHDTAAVSYTHLTLPTIRSV